MPTAAKTLTFKKGGPDNETIIKAITDFIKNEDRGPRDHRNICKKCHNTNRFYPCFSMLNKDNFYYLLIDVFSPEHQRSQSILQFSTGGQTYRIDHETAIVIYEGDEVIIEEGTISVCHTSMNGNKEHWTLTRD